MAENIDDEVNAIKVVLRALEPLTADARVSVIEYVSKRFGIAAVNTSEPTPVAIRPATGPFTISGEQPEIHLKEFTKQKSPRSASEMAAVVAYYLAERAPPAQRKKSVTAADIKTYFKIGDYPLPEVQFTLPNAKNAGYFDALGGGEYQLNAVGHNLVAHSLPRSGTATSAPKRTARRKGRAKRAAT
jgi:hypothetical protein